MTRQLPENPVVEELETILPSPFGDLLLRANDNAITRLTWLMEDEQSQEQNARQQNARHAARRIDADNLNQSHASAAQQLLIAAKQELEAYFDGKLRDFTLPLAPAGTAFQQRVWHEMAKIPFGQTMTYGQLADKSGSVARAVGGACGANPIPIIIPCHRVLGGGGKLGGFSGGLGPDSKRALLQHEGVLTPDLGF